MIIFVLLIALIEGALAIPVYKRIVKKIDRRVEERIKDLSTFEDSMVLKKGILADRKVALKAVLYTIFGFLLLINISICVFLIKEYRSNLLFPSDFPLIVVSATVGVLVVSLTELKNQLSKIKNYRNSSSVTVDDLLKMEEEYYLCIKGFDDDVPCSYKKRFQESLLANVAESETGISLYTLCAPRDNEWGEQLLLLIQKASRVVILIDNSESCVWMAEQSQKMSGKTVFIVDDIEEYRKVKERIGDLVDMPELPEDGSNELYYFIPSGIMVPFDNTGEGYSTILNLSTREEIQDHVEERKEIMRKKNVRDAKIAAGVIMMIGVIIAIISQIG